MGRRYVIVAITLAVLAAGYFALRRETRDSHDSGPRSHAPAGSGASPQTSSSDMRPIFQRLPVRLDAAPDAGVKVQALNGCFEGRVVSALTGKGLPGAQLTFANAGQTSSVSAAPDGSFRFEPHVSGRWLLAAATAADHLPFAPEWGQSPVLLEARPGEIVRGITVALSPAEEFEGRVLDPADKPVAGAEVTVLGGGAGASALVPLKVFRSNSSGVFRFTAPEDALVEATHEGFARGRARVDYSVRVSRRLTVRLKPSTEARFTIGGNVFDQDGSPAEGAVVSARSKSKPANLPMTTRVDVEGRFTLQDLEGGTWTLAASRPGSAPAFAEAAAGATGVRIQLVRGGELAGHVKEKGTAAPIAPFTVLVQSTEMRSISVIDPSGEYHLNDLAPGPAVVSVVAAGHAPSDEVRITIPAPGAGTATADFDLSAGGSLSGIVIERGTGAAIPGALVEVEGTPPSLGVPVRNETITDSGGQFSLNGLAESTIGIQASAAQHHARIISAPAIRDGETRGPITIELTPLKEGEDPRVELAGIGAMLQKNGDVFVVVNVAPNSGAAEVGLAPGDEVRSINGQSAQPMTFADAVPLLRGPEGTTVTLVVAKAGNAQNTVTLIVPRRIVRG